MNNYLTLIRKSDFTDLFKFGYLYIDNNAVVEFDGDIIALTHNQNIREKIFERSNQFDYSFVFILVHFRNDHVEDGKLYIEEVQNLFALDDDAKREIEISYDSRIRIENPIWPDAVSMLQEQFLFEDARKGALNIWNILKIEQPISDVESIISNECLREIVHEVQNDIRPEGNLSFWIYLLRYERHGFFPKKTSGFFMDLINVYINALEQHEISSEAIEVTSVFQTLMQSQNENMVDLLNILAETREGRNFFDRVNKMAGIVTNTNSVIVALLFLILRQKFINGFNLLEEKSLNYSREHFPGEINYALYLLGIFLGNRHTFECLYDTLPLPVFKPINKRICPEPALIPARVRKPGSRRNRKVKDRKAYIKLKSQGYEDDYSEGTLSI